MSKRFVIANNRVYDMYAIFNNTNLHIENGYLYNLDMLIGKVEYEFDTDDLLKAKAWDILLDNVEITDVSSKNFKEIELFEKSNKIVEDRFLFLHRLNNETMLEEDYQVIKQVLEVEQ